MAAEDGDRQYSTLDRAALAGIDQYKLIKTIRVEDDGRLKLFGLVDIDDLISNNIHTGNVELRVFQENHVCTDNTTTTPLAGGATFTGGWQDCLGYQEVNVSIVASHNSASNGLVFQWSADGVNIGDTDVFSYYSASGGTNYTPNPAFRYFRIVYTNGATPQTSFSLQTILRRSVTGGSFHRIDSTLKDDQDGRLVVAVPKLRTSANNWVSQQATNAGNAKVSVEELESAISVNNNSQLKITPYDSTGTEGSPSQMDVKIRDGKAYFARTGGAGFTSGNGGTVLIFNGTKKSLLYADMSVTGRAFIQIEKDVPVTNPFGTLINFINNDFNSANTTDSKMYLNPASIGSGTNISNTEYGELSVLHPVCPRGGWILKPNTYYVFKFVSQCDRMAFQFCAELYEVE